MRLALAFSLFAVPVAAENIDCNLYQSLAAGVMKGRQGGVSLARMIELADQSDLPAPDKELMKGFAMDAYEENLWSSESAKQEAITEFANRHMLACLQH